MTLPSMFGAIEFVPNIQDEYLSMVTPEAFLREETLIDDESCEPLPTKKQTNQSSLSSLSRLIMMGVVTGFLILLSLASYAFFVLVQFGEIDEDIFSPLVIPEADWFVFGLFSVLTQVDLVVLFVLICTALTCTITRKGMHFISLQFAQTPVKRLSIFVSGVYFSVGIVMGSFVPIVVTVVVDLLTICFLMVFCFNIGMRTDRSTDEQDDVTVC
jgi:hypothetical protein